LGFIHPTGKRNEQRIINAIIDMGGSATPSEITDYIFNKARNKIERYHPDFSKKKKYNITKYNAISLRGVNGQLKSLVVKEIVTKSKGVYSISDSADYRYFGRSFGRGALFLLMKAYGGGGTNTLQENTEELIKIFGTYVLYCFLEACKSYKLTDQKSDDDMVSTADKRVYSWVQDVLNPSDMFAYFQEIMESEDGLEENGMVDKDEDEDEYVYTPIDEKIIDRMLKIISKKYPEYYERLNTARERILFEVKRGYLDRSSGKSAPRDPPYA
jgi:hypothetical protein